MSHFNDIMKTQNISGTDSHSNTQQE